MAETRLGEIPSPDPLADYEASFHRCRFHHRPARPLRPAQQSAQALLRVWADRISALDQRESDTTIACTRDNRLNSGFYQHVTKNPKIKILIY